MCFYQQTQAMRLKKISVSILICSLLLSCKKNISDTKPSNVDFRQEMRNFVQEISAFSRSQKPGFIIIPQNGQELLTGNGDAAGIPQTTYINSINGVGREELFYGYDNNDDTPTPAVESGNWLALCSMAGNNGLKVLTTDYCFTASKVQDSYTKNFQKGFISFAAAHRELDNIPAGIPANQHAGNIMLLGDARNFLYLINTQAFSTKQAFINAVAATNYDVIIMDAFFQEGDNNSIWTNQEINQLKTKANGGKRLAIAYMSIGEAEDYRWYWQSDWKRHKPAWLGNLNPQWSGNYEVRYWMPDWKKYITGNTSSYTQQIIDAGFEGVYLDIIDSFEYWESL